MGIGWQRLAATIVSIKCTMCNNTYVYIQSCQLHGFIRNFTLRTRQKHVYGFRMQDLHDRTRVGEYVLQNY